MSAVEELVRDLVTKLESVADEFGKRVERLTEDQETKPALVDVAEKRACLARALLAQRRCRKKYLPANLFDEPAWDMLLALFIAHQENQVLFVKALVACSDAPPTTSQRWIEHLHRLGLVVRTTDPLDRRRLEVQISADGLDAITHYLEAIAIH